MRPMSGGVAVCVALIGAGLGACSNGEGGEGGGESVESSDGCGGGAPVLAFDHETTDPDRGIGGGVPEVSVVSADGDVEMITGSWVASQAAFSPDGDELVVVKADGDYESAGPSATALWIMGVDGSDPRELTGGDVLDDGPDWSHDGSSIVFVRAVYEGEGYTRTIATVPAEGGEPAELLRVRGEDLGHPVWSPDGRRIAFVRTVFGEAGGIDRSIVWTMAADGSDARPLVELPHTRTLDWHPDGSSLLVSASGQEAGAYQVDVATGQARLLAPGAELARWAPDGRSVYYFRETGPGSSDESDSSDSERLSIVEGRIDGGAVADERTVLDGADLDGTVLADVGLDPAFSLAVGPCG